PEHFPVVREHPCRGVRLHLWMQHIRHRRLEWLVVFRERAVHHLLASEQASQSLIVHNEGTDALGGIYSRPVVRDVDADPAAAIPLDDRLAGIPGLSCDVCASAIVQDATIGRPSPGPIRRDALLSWVRRVAAGHLVALLGEAAREDPAPGFGRAIIAQLRKAI